jgi:hypothetical protein
VESADESLDLGPADMPVGVPLRLDVHHVETKLVQADQAIKPVVPWAAEVLRLCL